MTDAEKLARITAKLEELASLFAHLQSIGNYAAAQQAKAFTLDKIAQIVGVVI